MAGSRREKSAETEQALKDAARQVFAEYGYLNAKITDITAAAGRAAGSFYNHFASKEELLQALLADIAVASDERAADPEHSGDFTDPAAIRYHVRGYWTFAREHAAVLRAIGQAAQVNPEFARIVAEFGSAQRADIADHVAEFPERGLRLPGTVDASLAMMFAAADGMLRMVEDGSVTIADDEAIESITRFVYRGITGRDY
ncbi:TetR/AcrR family transcriptional regulator [Nocardia asteroides NBRC 15531]|uniref:TetR family transcriptional regulator n=1 Tax=Nocardia asteroides NBRC 15531 TaxID=1110697 RepID=U5ECQ0_NOCAS|nr:TetR/AcrR family transcriptional regulator [Nocardia asteroides]TLF64278.1 TetR/AcrR family transcriptional regulator [Nocardia asteroides NBRC 15531]UGT50618.1 TetR/AcrR family transcriptional regulator [Nocardia asteroides]SFN32631.1 transcriptional regulator, TetR family [Nocardia asteroides]VEG36560.1 Toluene efflux pump ttgABC operon repressor [Nocardia asteroides]GAD84171.1 putative TetR family transcriptional regulator [Nocardia asteroides NBRC 15531]